MFAHIERRLGSGSFPFRHFHFNSGIGIPGKLANGIWVLLSALVIFFLLNTQPPEWTIFAGIALFSTIAMTILVSDLFFARTEQRSSATESARGGLVDEKSHVSEEMLAGIVASAMDAIIAVNKDQRIVLFNGAAEKMFHCSREDAVGSHINRFIPRRFHANHEKHIVRFGASGVTSRAMGDLGSLWAVRSNGEEFQIEASISSIEAEGRKLFTVVIRDITERKMTEETLSQTSRRLIEAQEEERRRIAREIHDDYNQRLAVIAIDLEALAEKVERSDVEASEKLHQLWNGVNELGKDLHDLSHRLHPSTLENLGLVAGIRSFCEEFADQHEMQLNFIHNHVPQGISEDAALCVFRVVQESLRNVKRHSGADRAEVLLEGKARKLHLSVTDLGRGFNTKDRVRHGGIGIRSMEERLRVLGGTLEVHSSPMEGTMVEAWLPMPATTRRVS